MGHKAAVIGDIHGEAGLLSLLIEAIRDQHGPDVALYHVGDMVDRGPDPKAVVQLCIDNAIKGVLGNHETWLHKYLVHGAFDPFALHSTMGGEATLRSYGIESFQHADIEQRLRDLIPQSHRQYLLALPLWRKIAMPGSSYRVTHTGVKASDVTKNLGAAERSASRLGVSVSDALCDQIAKASPTTMLWTPADFKNPNLHRFADGSCQIFGHTPVRQPLLTKWWMAIDTGSGTRPPHTLSAVILPSREIVSVHSLTGKTMPGGGVTEFTM